MAAVLTFEHGASVFEVEEGSEPHKALVKAGALLIDSTGPDEPVALEDLTVAELRAEAAERGLEVPAGAKKADLVELLSDAGEAPEDDEAAELE